LVELAEKHRRKNDATGEWENDGTATYYDVWVDRAQGWANGINENTLVTVHGNFKTKVSEKDGRKFYTNVINAREIEVTNKGGARGVNVEWATPVSDVEVPF
jgi:hypothetical protein